MPATRVMWFPSGEDEATYGTMHCEHTVLAIARTLTSTGRLLDAVQHFRGDFRVNVLFTVDETSRFAGGVRELLLRAGVTRIVPWDQVSSVAHQLAISASEAVDVAASPAPIVVLPHGLGFNKFVPDSGTGVPRLAGLPPADALRTGRRPMTSSVTRLASANCSSRPSAAASPTSASSAAAVVVMSAPGVTPAGDRAAENHRTLAHPGQAAHHRDSNGAVQHHPDRLGQLDLAVDERVWRGPQLPWDVQLAHSCSLSPKQ
jgi:hypothetical protein